LRRIPNLQCRRQKSRLDRSTAISPPQTTGDLDESGDRFGLRSLMEPFLAE